MNGNSLLITRRAVAGDQVSLRCNPLFLIGNNVYADAICSLSGETVELELSRQWGAQIISLSDEDSFMAGAAEIGLVIETALRDKKYRGHGFEPCFQRPCVEVVFLPRLAGESNASVGCDVRLPLVGCLLPRYYARCSALVNVCRIRR